MAKEAKQDRVVIKQPHRTELLYVADHLRAADKLELETSSGFSAHEAIFRSCGWSEVCWVAHVDGVPAIIFGVCAGGVVWLVGTDAISEAALPVFRLSKTVVRELLKLYPKLHNQADARNTLHLRWLRLMGFTMGEFVEHNGHPFQRFHIYRKEVNHV